MKKKKVPDYIYSYNSNTGEWVGAAPSILKEPYSKPGPTLERQIELRDQSIASLEEQVALLKQIIMDALKR
jgi:hypothetical protein